MLKRREKNSDHDSLYDRSGSEYYGGRRRRSTGDSKEEIVQTETEQGGLPSVQLDPDAEKSEKAYIPETRPEHVTESVDRTKTSQNDVVPCVSEPKRKKPWYEFPHSSDSDDSRRQRNGPATPEETNATEVKLGSSSGGLLDLRLDEPGKVHSSDNTSALAPEDLKRTETRRETDNRTGEMSISSHSQTYQKPPPVPLKTLIQRRRAAKAAGIAADGSRSRWEDRMGTEGGPQGQSSVGAASAPVGRRAMELERRMSESGRMEYDPTTGTYKEKDVRKMPWKE
ncbi:uncharacterized protein BDZ99DRAFT_524817 [Mytilinidion resinicola]|uniref:Uncharacterized protein n=1 Tax=Mytilinidion resinicola TaxID=574789 RepID=A0A6A6YB84_9PEZI|nr:uncharacterized protein BDZ99DRAFT_524817 [Mytilinidion resinicola]KAF2805097.1 hypothetical protein BDZ99DRAFT_524817 [Mytilinidion resinicola]